jgi:hypothetical protein
MSEWQQVGERLKRVKRRVVAPATHRESCDGCGQDVERTVNVLVDRTALGGVDPRTGQPVYRLEAFRALCQRCLRQHEETA